MVAQSHKRLSNTGRPFTYEQMHFQKKRKTEQSNCRQFTINNYSGALGQRLIKPTFQTSSKTHQVGRAVAIQILSCFVLFMELARLLKVKFKLKVRNKILPTRSLSALVLLQQK